MKMIYELPVTIDNIIVPALRELLEATFNKTMLQSKFRIALISSKGWKSIRANLKWKVQRTKSNRYLIQLGIGKADGINVLLPTPVASDGTKGGRKLTLVDGKARNISKRGVRYGITIKQLAAGGLLPTPLARLAKVKCDLDRGKGNLQDYLSRLAKPGPEPVQVNPKFISEMMGYPVNWLVKPFKKSY